MQISVAEADQLRAVTNRHFPPSPPPVAALYAAETARTITLRVTETDAAALHTVAATAAPDIVYDATQFLTSQLPRPWQENDVVTVLLSVGQARALHAHHSTLPRTRRTSSRTIRQLLTRANYLGRNLTVTVPWDAAHIIDTLHAIHPTHRLLRQISPNR